MLGVSPRRNSLFEIFVLRFLATCRLFLVDIMPSSTISPSLFFPHCPLPSARAFYSQDPPHAFRRCPCRALADGGRGRSDGQWPWDKGPRSVSLAQVSQGPFPVHLHPLSSNHKSSSGIGLALAAWWRASRTSAIYS